jgi:hypothetical protein
LQEGATLISSAASSTFAPTSLTLSGNLSDGWTTIALTNSGGEATLLTKSGALTLTLTGINDGTYSLTSATGFTGTFTSANVNGGGLATTDGGATFTGTVGGFNYTFTNANDQLIIVAIPEPATWALLAFGLTTVMVLRRRRNS